MSHLESDLLGLSSQKSCLFVLPMFCKRIFFQNLILILFGEDV